MILPAKVPVANVSGDLPFASNNSPNKSDKFKSPKTLLRPSIPPRISSKIPPTVPSNPPTTPTNPVTIFVSFATELEAFRTVTFSNLIFLTVAVSLLNPILLF